MEERKQRTTEKTNRKRKIKKKETTKETEEKTVVPPRTGDVAGTERAKGRKKNTTIINPFRAAVPFSGQATQFSSSLSPKWDCGSKEVTYEYEVLVRRVKLRTRENRK